MIKDSGDRTEFETGAVRDMREGKGRCDLMPLDVVATCANDNVLEAICRFKICHYKDFQHLYVTLELVSDTMFPNRETMFLEVAKHFEEEVLLGVLEGIKKIAAEYGLILNEKKTHICKLSSDYRYLQVKYTLLQNGIVVRRIHPKAITRERRKLKAYKRLLDKGIVTMEEIDGYFRSWLSGNYKYMSRDQIYKMNSLYVKLFGRSVTWKRGYGRLRWLMAHPSAA